MRHHPRIRMKKVPANQSFVYGHAIALPIESACADGIRQAAHQETFMTIAPFPARSFTATALPSLRAPHIAPA